MKRNSSFLILIILTILVGGSIFVYKKKWRSSTVDADARNFKLKDTSAITKIFIADKEGDQAVITRTKKGWIVNDKFPCRSDAILNLLEAIRNVEVKMPVNKSARENVLKVMASNALKVEIYVGDELVKQYYVGHETPDSEGSYMLLTDVESGKNYKEPFVCFIPGFVGYLLPRFIAKENEWRDRVVINYIPPQLKQIRIDHYENPDSSFTIDLIDTKTFILKNKRGEQIPFSEFKMKQYLAYLQNISYEALITHTNKKLEDSLSKCKPFDVITITSKDLRIEEYKFYHKKPNSNNIDHGIEYKYDPDRMYLGFNGNKELAIIQNFVFGKLLVTPEYFKTEPVKK